MLKLNLFVVILLITCKSYSCNTKKLIKRLRSPQFNSWYAPQFSQCTTIDDIPCKTYAEILPEDFTITPRGELLICNHPQQELYFGEEHSPVSAQKAFLLSLIIAHANYKLLKNPHDTTALTRRYYAFFGIINTQGRVDFDLIPYYAEDDLRYERYIPRSIPATPKQKPELPKRILGPKLKLN